MAHSVSLSLSKSFIDALRSVDTDKQEAAFPHPNMLQRGQAVICVSALIPSCRRPSIPPFARLPAPLLTVCYITHPKTRHTDVLFTLTHTPTDNGPTDGRTLTGHTKLIVNKSRHVCTLSDIWTKCKLTVHSALYGLNTLHRLGSGSSLITAASDPTGQRGNQALETPSNINTVR